MADETPELWAVLNYFPTYVVTASTAHKPLGAAVDPEIEAERYAKVIATCGYTEYQEHEASRFNKDSAKEHARRIVAAVNACAGVPEETLSPGVVKKMRDLLEEAHKQLLEDFEPQMDEEKPWLIKDIEEVLPELRERQSAPSS